MPYINKNDGKKIIAFIERTLNVELPKTGILAGQSVCSAILYLNGKNKDFHANDLDIFHMKSHSIEYFMEKDNELPGIGETHSKNIQFTYKDKKKEKAYLAENQRLRELFNSGEITEEEYLDLVLSPDYNVNVNAIVFNTPQTSYVSGYNYKILQVYRRELFNHIIVTSGLNDINNVIFGFDINSTQIGINLTTGELVFSRAFLDFLKHGQMKVTSLDRPHHTLIRYLSKRKEFAYKGNDEHELLALSLAMHMGNEDTANYIHSRLFKGNHKEIDPKRFSKLNFNRFGSTYLPKLEGVKDRLSDFVLKIEEIENKFYNNAPLDFMKRNLKSELGSFEPSICLDDCISLDYEIDKAKERFGSSILGGNRYLFSKSIDIIKQNNGMASEKKHSLYSLPSIKDILARKKRVIANELESAIKETMSLEAAKVVTLVISKHEKEFNILSTMFEPEYLRLIFKRLDADLANKDSLDERVVLDSLNNITLTDYVPISYEDENYRYNPVYRYGDILGKDLSAVRIRTVYLSAVLNYNFAWEITNKKNNKEFLYSLSVARLIHETNDEFKVSSSWRAESTSLSGLHPLDLTEFILDKDDGIRIFEREEPSVFESISCFKEWLSDERYLTKMINCRK